MIFPRHSHLTTPSLEDFLHQKKLGQGTYGFVSKYLHNKTQIPYAIKKMSLKDKQTKDLIMIQKQIEILYKIKNNNVVELIDHFENDQHNEIYLIMEYIEGQDLHKSVFRNKIKLQISDVANIIYQVAVALAELHKNNIIHRDLKLENVIYLPNKSIKLVDLGCSNYYGQDVQRLTSIGTKFYFSPQLLMGDEQNDKLDVWCLGVLLYQLLFLSSPFNGNDMFLKIKNLSYQIAEPYNKDEDLVDLFKKIFCYKQKRIRAKQVIQHRWIQKNLKKQYLSIDIQKQIIDRQQMLFYKEFLLEQISRCEGDIDRFKEVNEKLKEQIIMSKKEQ